MKSFIRKIIIACPLVAALLTTASLRASPHVWSGNGLTKNWNNANNWSSGGVPTPNEAAPVILEFPANITGAVTNNIANLKVDSIRMLSSGFVIRGASGVSLTLRGGNTGTNLYSAGVNYIDDSMPLVLEGNVRVISPVLLYLSSAISGGGGMTLNGGIRFNGPVANTYSGATIVQSGVVTLDKYFVLIGGGFALVSVPGPLFIEAGTVSYSSDNGIADTSSVQIETGGLLDLNGYDDTIGELHLVGGKVETDAGTLTLGGNVYVEEDATMDGKISLGGFSRTFFVEGNRSLTINAVVSSGSGISSAGVVKSGQGRLLLKGANNYAGNTAILDGTLEVHHNSALGSSFLNGTTVASNAVIALGNGVLVQGESLAMTDATMRADGTAAWTGPISLNGTDEFIAASTNHELALTGVVSGPGNFTSRGWGYVTLAGTNSNTFKGTASLATGSLHLAKSGGATAVPGDLFIGGHVNTNNADSVLFQEANQLSPTSSVSIFGSGKMYLNSDNTISNLVLHGGEVDTLNATLTLRGDVTVLASTQHSIIDGKLSLGGAQRNFDVALSPTSPGLEINAVVSGAAGGGILKTGGGELDLTGNNTYPGFTTIAQGWLVTRHPNALGDANPFNLGNGTVVNGGATLALDSVVSIAEKLTLDSTTTNVPATLFSQVGINSCTGPIVLNGDGVISASFGAPLTLSSAISGTGGFTKSGVADVTLNGNSLNSFTGTTRVQAGRLILAKPINFPAVPANILIGDPANDPAVEEVLLLNNEQIAGNATVTVLATGRLNLNNHSESFNQLLGSGEVALGYGKLTIARGEFGGPITGLLGTLAKDSAQTLILSGTNTFTGDTLLSGGALLVNGSIANSTCYVTSNAVLGGNGAVGSIHIDRGNLAPGSVNSPGKLTGKSVFLKQNSTFVVELNGELPGTQHDQFIAPYTVQLQGKLVVKLNGHTVSGDTFMILKKDGAVPISGTFSGLPEGQTFYVNSRPLQVTYQGGDGNDVVLRQTGPAVSSKVTGVSRSLDGNPVVHGAGIPFQLYNVERSFDFAIWTTLDTVAANDGGLLSYEDPDGFSHTKTFYRFLAVEEPDQF